MHIAHGSCHRLNQISIDDDKQTIQIYNVDPFEGDNDREPELIDAQEAIHKLIEHMYSLASL